MNLLLEGLGVCFLPERIASSYIESGRLEKKYLMNIRATRLSNPVSWSGLKTIPVF